MWWWLAAGILLVATVLLYRWASQGRSVPMGGGRAENDNQGKMASEINPPTPTGEHSLFPDRTGSRTRVELGGRPIHEDGVPGQERGSGPGSAH